MTPGLGWREKVSDSAVEGHCHSDGAAIYDRVQGLEVTAEDFRIHRIGGLVVDALGLADACIFCPELGAGFVT